MALNPAAGFVEKFLNYRARCQATDKLQNGRARYAVTKCKVTRLCYLLLYPATGYNLKP
jgi:hypothetical protein